ncbi:hypothetical protein PRIPAC_75100 [Pristionchus pacificus]|nr:hypothetical protein PRIPAC_75100 [Pristionchus pacificus]
MSDTDAKRIANLQMEELEFAKTSLETQMEIVLKWDKNRLHQHIIADQQTASMTQRSNEAVEYSGLYKELTIMEDINMDAHSKIEDEETYFDDVENHDSTVKQENECPLNSDEFMSQMDTS